MQQQYRLQLFSGARLGTSVELEGKLGDCACSADITSCDSEPILVFVFRFCIVIVLLSQCLLHFNFTCFEIGITTLGLFLYKVFSSFRYSNINHKELASLV